jgi:hypothetical protein
VSTESLEKRIANLEAMVTDLWKERKQVWDSEKERLLLTHVRNNFQRKLIDRVGCYIFFEPSAYKEATDRVLSSDKVSIELYLEVMKDLQNILKPLKEEGYLPFDTIEMMVVKDFVEVVKGYEEQ